MSYDNFAAYVNNDIGLSGGSSYFKSNSEQTIATLPTATPPQDILFREDISISEDRIKELEKSNSILQETVKFLLSKIN
jgi:hypothetical protein